ncbi:MAG: transglycosylase SLT domain-containing protein [Halioglobus sp.]
MGKPLVRSWYWGTQFLSLLYTMSGVLLFALLCPSAVGKAQPPSIVTSPIETSPIETPPAAPVLAAPVALQNLSKAREDYKAARKAISAGHWSTYGQLRPGLDTYPLAMYLDYEQLSRKIDSVSAGQAQAFIARAKDSPLANRFLSLYLRNAGKKRRWQDFLELMPNAPKSTVLQCYYYRAQLGTGNNAVAFTGAKQLWVYGKSRPKQCDPLFNAWMKAGELTDEVVWARLLKVFDERQGSLLRYVARQGSAELKPWSDRLLAVYQRPENLRAQVLPPEAAFSADIAGHGLAYLARYNSAKALQYWQLYQQELTFTSEQSNAVERAIALRGLFAKEPSMRTWLEGALARLGEDKLVELRLRWALAEGDWAAVEKVLPLLSAEAAQSSNWRYWAATVHERAGRAEESTALLTQLASERGYYSFLSADKLSLPYAFNHQTIAKSPALLSGLPPYTQAVMQRIAELHHHGDANLAHSEWFTLLVNTPDPLQKQQLAVLASEQGWYRMSIDAANRAKAWDALDLRFPLPYQNIFDQFATASKVPSSELMAIARRESAFFPEARSPVGARGLMQIMPATGRQVASSIGKRHKNADLYKIEHNVQLGSTYYRQLLKRFGGNRVHSLAAYNAGPHRVDRWQNDGGDKVPVEVWIETIPFKETRKYVQAVLSYNVVFGYRMGDTRKLLTGLEKQAAY